MALCITLGQPNTMFLEPGGWFDRVLTIISGPTPDGSPIVIEVGPNEYVINYPL
jgi:hypothetical protein